MPNMCKVIYMWHRPSDKKPLAFNNPLIMALGDAFDVALDPLIPTKEREEKKHSKGKKNSSNKITLDSSKKFNVDDKPKLDFMNAIVFEKDLEACSAEWCVDEEYMQGHTRSIELWSHQVEPCLGPTIS